MSPVQSKYVVSAAIVNHVIQKTLKHFEKDLGKGVIGGVFIQFSSDQVDYISKA